MRFVLLCSMFSLFYKSIISSLLAGPLSVCSINHARISCGSMIQSHYRTGLLEGEWGPCSGWRRSIPAHEGFWNQRFPFGRVFFPFLFLIAFLFPLGGLFPFDLVVVEVGKVVHNNGNGQCHHKHSTNSAKSPLKWRFSHKWCMNKGADFWQTNKGL